MDQKLVNNILRIKIVNIVTEKLAASRSAVDDLKEIYTDKLLYDVNLKTKTNSFPAHKIVLCARSPVFKVMLTNETTNSSSIQVDDLEDGTMQRLLLFLYSDKLEDLNLEAATKLYCAANKYQIEKLKLMCSAFFICNLSALTATELLVLADAHSDSDLFKIVADFISDHEELIFRSNDWQKFMEANPHLALKTMHFKYKTNDTFSILSRGESRKKHASESDHSRFYKIVRRMDRGPKGLCPRYQPVPLRRPSLFTTISEAYFKTKEFRTKGRIQ